MINSKKFIVHPSSTIREAIAKIDSGSTQIVLVVNESNRLLGVITDGDVRRAILKGISLDDPAKVIMNDQPVTAKPTDSPNKILSIMKIRMLRQIPVVDENFKVIGLEFLDLLIQPQKLKNIVVLMAGGLGSRLKPLTDDCPKPLLRIGDKPILETILESFIEYGFYQFYFSVNYKAEMVKAHFEDGSKWNVEINYLHEDKQLGTAGSLSLIPKPIELPLIVMNGDLLTKVNYQRLLEYHNTNQAMATMGIREYEFRVPYGVVKTEQHRILKISEKPLQKFYVNAGIYVLNPHAVYLVQKNTYLEMPSLFHKLLDDQHQAIVFPIREYWLDIGRFDDFQKANYDFVKNFGNPSYEVEK